MAVDFSDVRVGDTGVSAVRGECLLEKIGETSGMLMWRSGGLTWWTDRNGRWNSDGPADAARDIVRILPVEAAEVEGVGDDTKLTLDLLAAQGVAVENGSANWQVSLNETLSWSPDDGDDVPWGNGRMKLVVDGASGMASVDLDWPETVGELRPFGQIFRVDVLPNEANAQRADCSRRIAEISLEFVAGMGEPISPAPAASYPNAGVGCDLGRYRGGEKPAKGDKVRGHKDAIMEGDDVSEDAVHPPERGVVQKLPDSQPGFLTVNGQLWYAARFDLVSRAAPTCVDQVEWLKQRLADLQLPQKDHHRRDEWLAECGMPAPAPSSEQGGEGERKVRRELDAAVEHHAHSMKAIDLALGEPRYDDGSLLDCFLRRIAELQPSPPPSLPASDAPAAVIGGPGRYVEADLGMGVDRSECIAEVLAEGGGLWFGFESGGEVVAAWNRFGQRVKDALGTVDYELAPWFLTGRYVEPPKPPVPVLVIEEKSRVYGWVVAWSMFDKSFPAGQWLVDGGLLVQPIKALKGDMVVGYCDHVGLDMPKIRLYVHYDGPCMFLEEDWPRVQELVAQVNAQAAAGEVG